MKKKLVDLTYFSFPSKTGQEVIDTCYSTLGFLQKLAKTFSVSFIVRTENQLENTKIEDLELIFYKGPRLKKWQVPFKFNAFISSLKPDYILAHGFGYAHYLCFLKLINPKAKIVLQCNGYAPKPKGLKRLAYQISDKFIDGYLFTGIENSKPWYDAKIIKKEKVFEVMEGSTHFKFLGNGSRKENSFLWVASLISSKDPMTVLNAFDAFLAQQPLAKLTLVFQGGALADAVTQFVAANQKLMQSVELKGFITNSDLEVIYNQHQYFISGSHYEGSGYALAEAMACGCVPIVTRIPPFEYMTDKGNCGLLFEPKNEAELLEQLAKTRSLDYSLYQKKVLDQFEKKLSFQAIADGIAEIFQSL